MNRRKRVLTACLAAAIVVATHFYGVDVADETAREIAHRLASAIVAIITLFGI